jgi:outer membrane lipoprotein SlyB
MKTSSLVSLLSVSSLLAACTTEIGPNGQPRQVMTPLGAALVQGVAAAGIGAGTGAMMRGVNPVAAGAISAGAGSIGSQAINAFIPKSSGQGGGYQQQPTNQQLYVRSGDSFVPAKISYSQQPDGSYVPSYPRGRQLFRQLPNGSFAPVN